MLDILHDIDIAPFRTTPGAFSQDGPLQPDFLVLALLYLVADAGRRGYEDVLDALWSEASTLRIPLPTEEPVSAAAFCKARKKIDPGLLHHLLRRLAENREERLSAGHRWHGHRVFAVDGSKFAVHRSPQLWKAFGGPTGSHHPQMMATVLLALPSQSPVDFVVAPFASYEGDALLKLLDRLHPGDIVILDRGYVSFELFCAFLDRGIHFVVRAKEKGSFAVVRKFATTGRREQMITIRRPDGCKAATRDQIQLRAVRHELPDGRREILLTSVLREASPQEIGQLYWQRWQIEEHYKLDKAPWLSALQFHAKSAQGVEQELGATLLLVAISNFLLAAAAAAHGVPPDELARKRTVLRTAAYLTRLVLIRDHRELTRLLTLLLEEIARRRRKRRPGRSFPRRSYKPQPKWGARGHNGRG